MNRIPENKGVILKFRPRTPAARRQAERASDNDIDHLIDLSKFEAPKPDRDEFRTRMAENIAAAVVLCTLAAIGAVDLIDLERLQHAWP